MDIDTVINQLKAYVIPIHDEAEPNQKQTGVYQIVREKIGIIIDLDNTADRRGQAAATLAVRTIRAALFRALLNWRSDPLTQSRGFSYDGGNLLPDGLSRNFLRWQFDFVAETTITDADGWQPPSTPITELLITPTLVKNALSKNALPTNGWPFPPAQVREIPNNH
jgi:hypothetical protein